MASPDDLLPRALSLAVHELRTPLTVVSGYLRMLSRGQAGSLSPQQQKMIAEAERSCARLSLIAEEMSEFRRFESGEVTSTKQDVDIAGLLAELASGMHEGEDRGVRLELRGTDAPVVVSGDRRQLTVALKALMHAALRERAEGDVIAQCSTTGNGGAKYAFVAFSEEALLPALTEGLTRNSFGFDQWRGGTGLSLPVAYRVIENHGGRLWSAATAAEIAALDEERKGGDKKQKLSDSDRIEFTRKRAASALQLPLPT